MVKRILVSILVIGADAVVTIVALYLTAPLTDVLIDQIFLGLLIFIATGITTSKILSTIVQEDIDELCNKSELNNLGFDAHTWSKPNSETLKNLLEGIAGYWSTRDKIEPYLGKILKESLKNISDALGTLEKNRVHFRWQDIRDIASNVLREVNQGDKIYATSYVSTSHWWLDSEKNVHDYLIKKRDAAEAGAEVVQIFISPDSDSLKKDERVIKELKKTSSGNIDVYAISKSTLPHEYRRDILLLERKKGSLAFELDLKDVTWVEGFYVYVGEETSKLKEYFIKLQNRPRLIKFDEQRHKNFDDFVAEVFSCS